jgi:methylated-DNA-[protein]-cysteine S-methyltransferase
VIYIHHREIGGVWYAAAVGNGEVFATAFSLSEREVLRRLLQSLPYDVPFQMAEETSRLSSELLRTLKLIFDGKDVSPSFKIAAGHLSSYSRGVLQCVSLIPVGYITTYGAIAEAVGGSPRSVGGAVASNPFPLLIPCHRVVRADFSVGGYGLGEGIKRGLLQREDRGYEEATEVEVDGKILPLFPIKRLWKAGLSKN